MSQTKIGVLIDVNTRTNQLLELQRQTALLRNKFASMAKMGAAFLGVQVAVSAVTSSVRGAVAAGIDFNRMLQDTSDSLRAMALAGSAQGDMQAATRQSTEVLGILRGRANDTGQTLQTLIGVFQQSAGVAQQSGIALRDWAQVAAEATRAGANLGLSADQVRTNLQQIAMGDVSARNLLARAIGLDADALKQAQEAGTMIDLLRSKLGPYQTEIDGLSAAQNRLKNIVQEAWGRVALPLFERLEKETKAFGEALDGSGGSLQAFGQILADVLRVGAALLRVLIEWGPALMRIGLLIAGLRMASFAGSLMQVVAAQRAAVTATTALTAAKARLLAVQRALGLANPYTAIATAVMVVAGAVYQWSLSQREIARQLREIRSDTERIRISARERLDALTSEEQRQVAIKGLTADLLELEKKITAERRAQVRAALEGQAAEVRGQIASARALSAQELRDNARRAAQERQRQADLAALPDNLAALRQRQEEQRLRAMSPEQRVQALQEQREAVGPVGDLDALERRLAGLRESPVLEDLQAKMREIHASGPEVFRTQGEQAHGELSKQYALLGQQAQTARSRAEQQALVDAAEAELAANLAKAQQIAQIDEELAEAQRVLAEETSARKQALAQLDMDALRLTEQELRQSYERQGGDVRQYYQTLMALAAERWEREIAAAQEALAQASPAEREAAQLRIQNLERQKALALAALQLDRARELASQSRRHYESQIESVRTQMQLLDEALLRGADVAKRTELERTRKALIEEALKAWRQYRDEVVSFGLPERDLAPEPDFAAPPERSTRFARTQDAFDQQGSADQSYQSLGEAIEGGLMEAQMQMGTLWDNIAEGITTVASQVRDSIGGAIEGLLTKTMSWGDALRSIATGFGRSMIQAISDIAAKWAVEQALMVVRHAAMKGKQFAIDAAYAAKGLAMSLANAAKSLIAWIPSAIAASISSFGVAAAIGVAAVVALLAKGFAGGGYTGPGGVHQPAGVVHAGEWVAPQWQVMHPVYGPMIAQLESARSGRGQINYSLPSRGYASGGHVAMPLPGIGRGSAGADDPASRRPLTVAFVDDRRIARQMERDPDVQALIIDLVKRNRGELFA